MNKREAERAKLYSTIWKIANDLRGSIDGWDFKNYVLIMLFYRYISENLANYFDNIEKKSGNQNFDYSKLSDSLANQEKQNTIDEKGFFILPSQLFKNVYENFKTNGTHNLNEILHDVFTKIENSASGQPSEEDFKGLLSDLNLNDNKLGNYVTERNKTLFKTMEAINYMELDCNFQENTIDAFGDAYEYLLSMYASNAGKSGGEYFTPQEVSELLARLTVVNKKQVSSVYDPACGSGSLLLKFAKILGKDNITKGFFGQEKNPTTYNLCRINMFLHDISFSKFDIKHGDTLISPQHLEEDSFEAIVSNPPYSITWDGDKDTLLINDERFSPAGVLAPKSKADFAFIMHSLHHLKNDGVAAIVCFPGILYRSGAEQKIRKYLIDYNFIDCIIQLPVNLFFGTSIQTCIMVLSKSRKSNDDILFIDASNEFTKVTNSNKLSQKNIDNIVNNFKNKEEKQYFSKLVSKESIIENEYSLSVNTYIEKEDLSEKIDIVKLNQEIEKVTKTNEDLRKSITKIVKEIEFNHE